MKCNYCGEVNRDDYAFCKACGRPLARNAEPPAAVIKRWLRRRAAVVLTALLTVALAVALLTVKAGPRINMDRYLVIDQSGYDGYGTVSVRIDWEAIKDKYGSRLKLTRQAKKAKKALGILGDMFSPMTLMKLYISVETDASSMTSNGESVGYSWSYDEKLTDYVKCRIKCKDGRLEVKDLKRVREFDPFDDILVEFSGLSSEGTADFQYSGSELSRFDFSFDKEAGLKNGDRVTLKLDLSDSALQNMAKTQGKAPKQLTKKYTVSGLRELVKWDPFDGFALSCSGYSGFAEAKCEPPETPTGEGSYRIKSGGKQKSLKNGDTITIEFFVNSFRYDTDEYFREKGYALERTEKEFTVSGLEEAVSFDPFDYITLSFSGLEPHGEVRIELKKELPEFWDKLQATLECYQSGHLSNGDEFTVYFKTSGGHDAAEYCLSQGIALSADRKVYTVQGLYERVRQAEEILKYEGIGDVIEEAELLFPNSAQNATPGRVRTESAGYVFLVGEGLYSGDNELFLLFKNTERRGEEEFLYYFYIVFNNIALNADGSEYAYRSTEVCSKLFNRGGFYYRGFEDIETMYERILEYHYGFYESEHSFSAITH